ncbi:o-succinylbenzoate synthase [Xanthomarina gelatinilytica]|uniref:o-succinylbenzoate synthase n=1 Tax=Xanthomarina gelatinilytica TaxID=1137281 RepID=UPI003AA97CD9
MKATYKKYILNFKQASGTSRGVLRTKETWFLILEQDDKIGVGECGLFRGLSADDVPHYEEILKWTCLNIHLGLQVLLDELYKFPSIQFGLETAFASLNSDDQFVLLPSNFTKGTDAIPINGLIWMGSESFMKQQIKEKIEAGFSCIKMKIGAIDYQTELDLLKSIRKEFSNRDIILRVDANGAFSASEALEKLHQLAELQIHSIEQPIKQGQWQEMARLCEKSPIPIALDEELIGIFSKKEKIKLLQTIKPQYIILKPSLIGGFKGSGSWVSLAQKESAYYWVTSALESNVGLNAIAQWTYMLHQDYHQGLGTGGLFTNNFDSPLLVKNGTLQYQKNKNWNFNL